MNLLIWIVGCAIASLYCAGEKKWGWFVLFLALAFCGGLGLYFRVLGSL